MTERQTDRETETDIEKDKETDRGRQIDRQRQRQTEKLPLSTTSVLRVVWPSACHHTDLDVSAPNDTGKV